MSTMALEKRVMGRPSLGERHSFAVKLPLSEARKLRAVIDNERMSAQAYIGQVLSAHLATIDLDSLDGQEALPIDQAS